jgi:Domain of unknown function (DUF4386)
LIAMTALVTVTPETMRRLARWGGLMYLAIIALGLFGEGYVRSTLVMAGDAAATAANIAAAPGLWRAGVAGDLLMHVLDVPLMLIMFLLLAPQNLGLAVLATLFNMVQTAVLVLNKLTLVLPLLLINQPTPAAADAVRLAINAHGFGFAIGLVFFGAACLVRAWVLHGAAFAPRWLAPALALAGLAYLVNSAALLLAPGLARLLFPYVLMPAFVGELAFALLTR